MGIRSRILHQPHQFTDKMDEWLDGDITDSELVETIGDSSESFDRSDKDAYAHSLSALQYLLIRQITGKWYGSHPLLPEIPDSYSLDCLGRIFTVCLSGNWSDWLRILRGYSPGIEPDKSAVGTAKEPSSITDVRSALDRLFIHLKADFIKDSL